MAWGIFKKIKKSSTKRVPNFGKKNGNYNNNSEPFLKKMSFIIIILIPFKKKDNFKTRVKLFKVFYIKNKKHASNFLKFFYKE